MKIQDMFVEDINRKINGVVQVEDDSDKVLVQEVEEYVVTKELKKYFMEFFEYYSKSFEQSDYNLSTGVWISGFFGSGKSHFLKMLSYILENKTVAGKTTVERFRPKFEKDPMTFAMIEQCTTNDTETILFNIDNESSINKDKTAIRRVFAKMFYDHLGFYGDDLKVARLEQFLTKQGKLDEFHRVFEEINGDSWLNARSDYEFFADDVIDALQRVLGMSEESARGWINGSNEVELTNSQLVAEMKAYTDQKPDDFRMIFLVDEVGQYIGEDTSLLLNLQTLIEEIGSHCNGKIWIICTGQEAIDEIIRTRQNEFSRIQARFALRLSLSSTAVDEVIQKRLLAKKVDVIPTLESVYERNASVMRNLFHFSGSVSDIKGYKDEHDFVTNFPFVPYQFILVQKAFSEIRKHGNAGKHYSGAERSMLSGFQEAAQKVENGNEYTIVPLFRFYDSLHSFLDSAIRLVIERCLKAADEHNGIEPFDVDLLKLLYLIRYVSEDVPSNIDNLSILMADNINVDILSLRKKVGESLNRLEKENYIGRTGDIYTFLTDDEQDIQREIKNTPVDTSAVVSKIGNILFNDIYTSKKYRYNKNDFNFDTIVDHTIIGTQTNGMKLRVVTIAADTEDCQPLRLLSESNDSVIILLSDSNYFDLLTNAEQIQKFVKQRNISQLPQSQQDIIQKQQREAKRYEKDAKEKLLEAIVNGQFFVAGEQLQLKAGTAQQKIDEAFKYLVQHVYKYLNCITNNANTDQDILNIATGKVAQLPGHEDNKDAADKIEEYLETQELRNLPTSMQDIQSRFQAMPYGWKEIDIAAVVALLLYQQKITLKVSGEQIRPTNPRLADYLRKKSEVARTQISKRHSVNDRDIRNAKRILSEYFNVMNIPDDEDSLVTFIINEFNKQLGHYQSLLKRYENNEYPDKDIVKQGYDLALDILSQDKDNIALISRIVEKEDDLLDFQEDVSGIDSFFNNQVSIYDRARQLYQELLNDTDAFDDNPDAKHAYQEIKTIILPNTQPKTVYRRVPELTALMNTVELCHNTLLGTKRAELTQLLDTTKQTLLDLHPDKATQYQSKFNTFTTRIKDAKTLTMLDGIKANIFAYQDAETKIEEPHTPTTQSSAPVQTNYKNVYRQQVFPQATIKTQEDIDNYINNIRKKLELQLQGTEGLEIK